MVTAMTQPDGIRRPLAPIVERAVSEGIAGIARYFAAHP
jgi:hypothetical protein